MNPELSRRAGKALGRVITPIEDRSKFVQALLIAKAWDDLVPWAQEYITRAESAPLFSELTLGDLNHPITAAAGDDPEDEVAKNESEKKAAADRLTQSTPVKVLTPPKDPNWTGTAAAVDGEEPWEGVLVVEGGPTGDGRQFNENSLVWGELPMPLGWKKERAHGGMDMGGVINVGRIDSIERRGKDIYATGVIDMGHPDGMEAARQMRGQFLRGVSIDADDPDSADVEFVWAEGCDEPMDAEAELSEEDFTRCMSPELTIYHSGRIRAATLCDIPAFVEAQIRLVGDPNAEEKPEVDAPTVASVVERLTAAAHVIQIEDLPPAAWFLEPEDLPPVGAITVTDDGRIFGLLAPSNTAHRGHQQRVTVPLKNVDYSHWMNRETITADGRIASGPITMDCGHASTSRGVGALAAVEHYDNSCSIVGTARVGEGKNGVWLAGSLLPDVTPAQVARLLACQLSGDWRPHREKPGMRQLCGVLAVPVPGFSLAARRATVRVQQGNLVASAVPINLGADLDCGCAGETSGGTSRAITAAAGILARSVGRDARTRATELAKRVRKE